MENRIEVNPITQGVIWKQLLIFFYPILIGTFFQQLYNTVDAIVVGRFVGKVALAAVGGSAGHILGLMVGFFVGLTSGAAVVVAQAMGVGDKDKVSRNIHTIYGFSIVGGLVMTALGLIFSPYLLEMMHTPEDLMKDSKLYLNVFFSGTLFTFIFNTGSSILRALGDSKRPLIYLAVCCVVNIVLDLVFVLLFKMEILGVALATVIAQAVSAVLVTRALMKSRDLCHFSLRQIRIDGELLKRQLLIGLPSGISSSMYSISNIIVQTAVNNIGTDAAAGWAALIKLDGIYWMIGSSLGIAVTTFVGQNFGAGRLDRVRKSTSIGLFMNIATAVVTAIILVFFSRPLLTLFTDDPAVLDIAVKSLRIMAPFYALFAFIEVYSASLRGMGDSLVPMIMTMVGICGFRIAWCIFIVPLAPTMETISYNYPCTWIITASAFIFYYAFKIRRLKTSNLRPV